MDSENLDCASHTRIRKSVIFDTNLSRSARFLYVTLRSTAGSDASVTASVGTMCHSLGVNKRSLSRYVKELVAAKLLRVEQTRKNGSVSANTYTLID